MPAVQPLGLLGQTDDAGGDGSESGAQGGLLGDAAGPSGGGPQADRAEGHGAGGAAATDAPRARHNVRSDWKQIALRGLMAKVAQNKPLRSLVGTNPIMDGDALGCLPVSLSSRRRLFRILSSQPYEYFKGALIASHLVVLALDEPMAERPGLEAANVAIVALYTAEVFGRIVSQGLIRGRNTYLRNSWFNVLEMLDCIVSWALIIVRASSGDEPFTQLSALRAYRMLLVFKAFRAFSAVNAVLEALASSAALVVDLFALFAVFFTFFALMGQLLFMGSMQRRCVTLEATGCNATGPDALCDVLPLADQLEARLAAPEGESGLPLLGYPQALQFCAEDKGHACDATVRRWALGGDEQSAVYTTQTCANVDNLNGGYNAFDSFPWTMLTMFQTITLEGWQDIMFATVDTEYDASAAYFVFLIILITFFFVSVFVAAISGVFLRLRREHQLVLERRSGNGGANAAERSLKRVEKLLNIGGGSITASGRSSEDNSEGDAIASIFAKAMAAKKERDVVFEKPPLIKPKMSAALAAFGGAPVPLPAADKAAAAFPEPSKAGELPEPMEGSEQSSLWDKLHVRAFILINNTRYFDHLSAVVTFLNVVVMGLHHVGTDDDTARTYEAAQWVLMALFALEQAVRMTAAGGAVPYFGGQFPLALVDALWLVLGAVGLATGLWPNFTIFRALLLFRLYPSKVLGKVSRNFTTLLSTVLFYLFTCFVCALLAMELYGGEYIDESVGNPYGRYRRGFETFGESFLTMLQVSTGEDWNRVLYATMDASDNAWFAPFFFAFFFCFSNYILLNLIIAVILENMELQDAEKLRLQQEAHDKVEEAKRNPQKLVGFVGFVERLRGKQPGKVAPAPSLLESSGPGPVTESVDKTGDDKAAARRASRRGSTDVARLHENTRVQQSKHRMSVSVSTLGVRTYNNVRHGSELFPNLMLDMQDANLLEVDLPSWAEDVSLWLLEPDSAFRQRCGQISQHRWFQLLISAAITLSIAGVVMTKPVGEENDFDSVITGINFLVFFVFLVDAFLKIVHKGFLMTPSAYLHDEFNCIDLVVLLVDAMSLVGWGDYLLRAVRMAQALRPMRLLGHVNSIRDIFESLIKSIPGIVPVFLLGSVIFVCFAIFGMHAFGGKLSACNDGGIEGRLQCTGVYARDLAQWSDALAGTQGTQGGMPLQILMPRVWQTPSSNFDTLGSSLFSVFQVASLDGWVETMHTAMDARGGDLNPEHNASWWSAFYFVALVIVGSFYIVRVFVGVFIDQFGYINGSKLLTERQKLWRDMHRFALRMVPQHLHTRPESRLGGLCYDMVQHRHFSTVMTGVLLANMVVLASTTFDQDAWRDDMLTYTDVFFVVLYALEATARCMEARNWRSYLRGWNLFELIIVVGSGLTLGLWAQEGSFLLKAGRPFRFLRAFRVIRFSPALDSLWNTIVITFPAVFNVAALLMIFMFAFAGVAVQLFPNVRYGLYLTHQANFTDFPRAFMLLFQLMTGEGWVNIMEDSRVGPPHCSTAAPGIGGDTVDECGFQTGGRLFYFSFVLCCSYIFLNLFVAVVLDTVTFGLLKERAIITTGHLVGFQREWSKLDPAATGRIPHYRLRELVINLGAPLGPPTDKGKPRPTWLMRLQAEVHRMNWSDGVPFRGLIELLMLMRLNKNALTLDARMERERFEKGMANMGATLTIQRFARGLLSRSRTRSRKEAKDVKDTPMVQTSDESETTLVA